MRSCLPLHIFCIIFSDLNKNKNRLFDQYELNWRYAHIITLFDVLTFQVYAWKKHDFIVMNLNVLYEIKHVKETWFFKISIQSCANRIILFRILVTYTHEQMQHLIFKSAQKIYVRSHLVENKGKKKIFMPSHALTSLKSDMDMLLRACWAISSAWRSWNIRNIFTRHALTKNARN